MDAQDVALWILGAVGGAGGVVATLKAAALYVSRRISDAEAKAEGLLTGQLNDLREGYSRMRDERDAERATVAARDARIVELVESLHELELSLARHEAQEGQSHATRSPPPL